VNLLEFIAYIHILQLNIHLKQSPNFTLRSKLHLPYFLAAFKIFKLDTVESNHNFARAGMVTMFAQPYALKQNPNKIWQFEYMQFVILSDGS